MATTIDEDNFEEYTISVIVYNSFYNSGVEYIYSETDFEFTDKNPDQPAFSTLDEALAEYNSPLYSAESIIKELELDGVDEVEVELQKWTFVDGIGKPETIKAKKLDMWRKKEFKEIALDKEVK